MSLPNWSLTPEPKISRSPEWRVPLSELSYTEVEVESVTRVLRSGWWTCGPETEALEREFERHFGFCHAVAVSSGTAALHLAFLALGLSHREEVVTPSLNFVAAANTILHAGAVPRFADVDSIGSPVVSAATLERALTPKTRGLCIMHYGGYPCDMRPIVDLARRRRLWLVEDAAHAPGAILEGISCGRWGDIACFSFFGNKNLTCAEGGMIATESDDLAKRLRLLRSHGMNSLTWDRFRGHSFSYDVTTPGFNYRMDDLRAALLRVQLRSLEKWNHLREERVQWYRQLLSADSRWIIPFENHAGKSSYHLFTIVLDERVSRNDVMHSLRSKGIQTSIHYPPIHQFSCYRALSLNHSGLKCTEDLGRRILTLPLYPNMTFEQVEMVCESLRDAIGKGTGNV
ncbi:MAG: DegT/DnrJ/EryC1/StrS aminotransferase family protein [Acidobacteria bacterium]|nr:DegT/DnrJ/EryC1/StrS aminotransferase family protein [Acidobacteriota bacterium]